MPPYRMCQNIAHYFIFVSLYQAFAFLIAVSFSSFPPYGAPRGPASTHFCLFLKLFKICSRSAARRVWTFTDSLGCGSKFAQRYAEDGPWGNDDRAFNQIFQFANVPGQG